ncbi:HalOD1 output domain-containing protein [Natrarchaeobius chitinivorans]|uniref:Halobacterial output domain-containing protein n=1 Tax=Natrarchaeobius chitinivorans TaxID=1679083 RepID=A0A3N6MDU0_NATCH|nr:HalOD1 output domain-containing protein [Natrarchaeobius chitinivorans]RQG91986.1 hypothetical protein EA473_18315 [Natrarchaeobius chitinivorans]
MDDAFDPPVSVQYDPETETYRGRFDSNVVTPSTAVSRVVASLSGEDVTDLPPLYDFIDPDALDTLCTKRTRSHRKGDCAVEFTYHGHRVRLESYGILKIEHLGSDAHNTK